MRRMDVSPAVVPVADKQGRLPLHLVIDRALCGSETLVVLLGRTGLACRTVTGASSELPTLLEWLERRKPCPLGLRDHVMRALAVRASDEPQATAAIRELQVLMPLPRRHVASPDRPVGGDIDVAVSTGDGGLFVAGWLHDPHNMVEGLRITSPFGEDRTITDLPHRFPREDVSAIYKSASPRRLRRLPSRHPRPRPGPAIPLRIAAALRRPDRHRPAAPPAEPRRCAGSRARQHAAALRHSSGIGNLHRPGSRPDPCRHWSPISRRPR